MAREDKYGTERKSIIARFRALKTARRKKRRARNAAYRAAHGGKLRGVRRFA
jgi:hypothetical protein